MGLSFDLRAKRGGSELDSKFLDILISKFEKSHLPLLELIQSIQQQSPKAASFEFPPKNATPYTVNVESAIHPCESPLT